MTYYRSFLGIAYATLASQSPAVPPHSGCEALRASFQIVSVTQILDRPDYERTLSSMGWSMKGFQRATSGIKPFSNVLVASDDNKILGLTVYEARPGGYRVVVMMSRKDRAGEIVRALVERLRGKLDESYRPVLEMELPISGSTLHVAKAVKALSCCEFHGPIADHPLAELSMNGEVIGDVVSYTHTITGAAVDKQGRPAGGRYVDRSSSKPEVYDPEAGRPRQPHRPERPSDKVAEQGSYDGYLEPPTWKNIDVAPWEKWDSKRGGQPPDGHD